MIEAINLFSNIGIYRLYSRYALLAALTMFCMLTTSSVSGESEGWVKNTLNAGPPYLPQSVIDFCLAEISITHEECLILSGWPPGREELPQKKPPKCNMNSCNAIHPVKWKSFVGKLEGLNVQIPYATWFNLNRQNVNDWKMQSESQILLINLQNTIDDLLRKSLPNGCEDNTVVTSRSDTVSGDTYTYKANMRTDIRSCDKHFGVDVINDIGEVNNSLSVQIRAYIEEEKLKIIATNTFHEGDLDLRMKILFDLEKLFNFATGHFFRSGNQRKYDELINNAIQQAIEKSGEKLSQRVMVPSGKIFENKIEYTRMEMTSNGAVLKVGMSANIPDSVVCDIRDALNEMNNFKCTAPISNR